jgi:hypothetical protein
MKDTKKTKRTARGRLGFPGAAPLHPSLPCRHPRWSSGSAYAAADDGDGRVFVATLLRRTLVGEAAPSLGWRHAREVRVGFLGFSGGEE